MSFFEWVLLIKCLVKKVPLLLPPWLGKPVGVISFISVPSAYEVGNGILGMQRDIILQICALLWCKKEMVRVIIGICGECFHWRKHYYFLRQRPCNIPISFRPNPKGGYTLTRTREGIECVFTYIGNDARTIFLDREIVKGIYSWKVQIDYGKDIGARIDFWIGYSPSHTLSQTDDHTFGFTGGSAGLNFWMEQKRFCSGFVGVTDEGTISTPENKIPNHSFVTVEVDACARTLAFFANDMKIPQCIANADIPLYLGITGDYSNNHQSFTSLTFTRLPAPTPSPVVCTYYEPRNVKESEY